MAWYDVAKNKKRLSFGSGGMVVKKPGARTIVVKVGTKAPRVPSLKTARPVFKLPSAPIVRKPVIESSSVYSPSLPSTSTMEAMNTETPEVDEIKEKAKLSIPTWAIIAGGGVIAYLLFFRK